MKSLDPTVEISLTAVCCTLRHNDRRIHRPLHKFIKDEATKYILGNLMIQEDHKRYWAPWALKSDPEEYYQAITPLGRKLTNRTTKKLKDRHKNAKFTEELITRRLLLPDRAKQASGCSTCPLCKKRAPRGCDLAHWIFRCAENAKARKIILGNLDNIPNCIKHAYTQIISLLKQPEMLNQLTEDEQNNTVNTLVIGPNIEHSVFKCDLRKDYSERNCNYQNVQIMYGTHVNNMKALKSTWTAKSAKKCHKLYERWALEREQHINTEETESETEAEAEEGPEQHSTQPPEQQQ